MGMKPFRFGVNFGHAQSRAQWQETARKVEDLGYATLTVPDHLTDLIAPMPALVSAAEATTHLRVGTYVLNNDLRHPVLVAREAASVDLLTDGRLQLGLGAGSIQSEYDQAGLGFDRGSDQGRTIGGGGDDHQGSAPRGTGHSRGSALSGVEPRHKLPFQSRNPIHPSSSASMDRVFSPSPRARPT